MVARRGRRIAAGIGSTSLAILFIAAWTFREPIAVKLGLRDRWILGTLERSRLTYEFDQRNLAEVLRHLENSLNVRFAVDDGIDLEELTVHMSARNQKAVETLAQIMAMTGLGHAVSGGTIRIFRRHLDGPLEASEFLGRIRDFGPKTHP